MNNNDIKHYIYFLKSISIIAVILIHIIAGVLYWQHGFNFQVLTFFRVVVGFAVPVFFMCSGAILLHRDIDSKAYIIKTLKILFFVAILYEVYDIIVSNKTPKNALYNLVMFKHHFHLYFLNVMILIYALMPILRCFVLNASRQLLEYALIFWCFTSIILPTLYQFYPFSELTGTPEQIMLSVAYGRVGYFVFGYYLDKYKPIQKISYSVCMSIFAIIFATTGILLMSVSVKNFYFLDGMSVPIAIYATGVFTFGQNFKYSHFKIFEVISGLSFLVYLYHDFFNMIFRRTLPEMSAIKNLIILFICVTISSFLLAYILKNLKTIISVIINFISKILKILKKENNNSRDNSRDIYLKDDLHDDLHYDDLHDDDLHDDLHDDDLNNY